jgi:hypothetical protein
MSEPTNPAGEGEGEISRGLANLVLLAAFLVIVGIGVWLAFALDKARNADNCISQGRRNCAPIQAPPR